MAKKFRNMAEIVKYYTAEAKKANSSALPTEIKNAIVPSKETVEEAAKEFVKILKSKIRYYFDTTNSKWSKDERGNHERESRRFENSVKYKVYKENGVWNAKVYFDDKARGGKGGAVWRKSLYNNDYGGIGYLPALLDEGWQVKKGSHKDIPNFGYFRGAGFIAKAISEAKTQDKFASIKIEQYKNY